MYYIKIIHVRLYTLKTGIPVEEGDSILKLLQRVSRPEIQLGVGIHSELDHLFNNTPPLLLSTVMEFTFQVRSKLLTFSLRKLCTSSLILNFLECNETLTYLTFLWVKSSCMATVFLEKHNGNVMSRKTKVSRLMSVTLT